LLRERNQLDLELHRFAGELLESRIAADPGHAAELERFERLNPVMGRYVGWAIAAKLRIKGSAARVVGKPERS
jgi:hypothetical protein